MGITSTDGWCCRLTFTSCRLLCHRLFDGFGPRHRVTPLAKSIPTHITPVEYRPTHTVTHIPDPTSVPSARHSLYTEYTVQPVQLRRVWPPNPVHAVLRPGISYYMCMCYRARSSVSVATCVRSEGRVAAVQPPRSLHRELQLTRLPLDLVRAHHQPRMYQPRMHQMCMHPI